MPMDAFDTDELAWMQAAQEDGMMDTCVVLSYADGATDAYGMPVRTWVESDEMACGYDGRRHTQQGVPAGTPGAQVELTDGRIRLPIDTVISVLDRIRVTHRFGVELSEAIEYEVIGEPRRGPSGLLVDVRRVTSDG